MRLLSRALTVASLVIGTLIAVLSLIIAGPTISTGLVIGIILVLNGVVRLYPLDDG